MKRFGERLGGEQAIEGILVNRRQFAAPKERLVLDEDALEVKESGVFRNPHAGPLRQRKFACGMLEYDLRHAHIAEMKTVCRIVQRGGGGGGNLRGLAGEPEEGAGIEQQPHSPQAFSSSARSGARAATGTLKPRPRI